MLDAALRFLEARPRSVAEVRRRLTSAGYQEELVAGAIERLEALGILDDQSFATQWIASRDRVRPRGERALRSELGQRGVERAVVDAVLDERRETFANESATPENEHGVASTPDAEAATRLLARRGRSLERVGDPRARRQRAYALLARNGFDSSVAQEAAAAWSAGLDASASVDADTDADTDADEQEDAGEA